ncbi:MAG: restriction endonuclease subunit S [Thermoleophilia bacterium]|nr:restriction endonuclease subunit S [Thermoleophilia bacterium]
MGMTTQLTDQHTMALPPDWRLARAGDLGCFRGGSGFPTVCQGQLKGLFPFFKVSDMNIEGNRFYLKVANNYISEPVRLQLGAHAFPANTIAFAKVGAAIFLERKKLLAQPSCLDNNMAGYSVLDPGADFRFLNYFFQSIRLGDLVSTTALPALNSGVLNEIQVPIPPKLEQEAIAEALSDADALIASLEQLIAKKRLIKQGVMQELLTGKRRLPGFAGEWGSFEFHEVFRRLNAKEHQVYASDYRESGDFPVVDQGKKYVVGYTNRRDRVFKCPAGGVIVFGDHTCIVKFVDFDFAVGADGTQLLSTQPMHDCRFHAFQLDANPVISTGYNRHFKFLLERRYYAPKSIDEQQAISRVLSGFEAEVAGYEVQLDKARQLKQGMMQQLLTGRIRLL